MKKNHRVLNCCILMIASLLIVACNKTLEVNAKKLISKTEISQESYTLEVHPKENGKVLATFKGKEKGYPVFRMSNNKKYKYYIQVDSTYYLFNLK